LWRHFLFKSPGGSATRLELGSSWLAPTNRCVIPDPAHPEQNPDDPIYYTVSATETVACASNSDCAQGESCKYKLCDYACQLDSNGVSESERSLVGGMFDSNTPEGAGHVTISNDIVVTADAPLDHWVFANTGLKVGDVIPGLIGTEYDVINSNFPKPDGLVTLLRTQAPDFRGGGGFRLPDTFDGKDFDGWYASFVNAGRALDPYQCNAGSRQRMICTTDDSDPNTGCPGATFPGACTPACDRSPIPPLNIAPTGEYCRNPLPEYTDWAMTIYRAPGGAWVFNAPTNQWAWGLDDYFTGLTTADGANNGPAFRFQCGYAFFHPGLVSCRSPAVEQITRNVLDKFIGRR
jgi:hypothetical protein